MKQKKLHITILFILLWSFSFAQQYTNYTTKDGLPSNHVYTILQDAKGFIWFLTAKGMVKYNGENFKTFTTKDGLPSNDIWEALITPDTKVWYLSKSATLGYIENDRITSFSSENNEIINPIFTSQIHNKVYPTGPQKTYELEGETWKVSLNNSNTSRSKDRIKVFHKTVKEFVTHFNGKLYTKMNIIDKDDQVLKSIEIKELFQEKNTRGQLNDSLFFWSANTQYAILNLNTLQFKHYYFKDLIDLKEVKYSRINVVNDRLQISGNGFVGYLDNNFKIVDPFYFPTHMKAHFGLIDNFKNVWIATFSNGVYKLPYHKRNVTYHLINEKIHKLNVINENIIASVYNKGFYKYNATTKEFKNFISSNEQYVSGAAKIEALQTEYYITENDITLINNSHTRTIPNSLFYKNEKVARYKVNGVLYHNHSLYANSSFEIIKLNAQTLIAEEQYIVKGCNSIYSYNDRLLLATTDGLKELINDEIIPIKFNDKRFNKSIKTFTKINATKAFIGTDGFGGYIANFENNLLRPLINSEFLTVENAIVDHDNLWLATNEGVLKYVLKTNEYTLQKTLNSSNGLPSNNINDIAITNHTIVVATDNGIAILPKNHDYTSQFLDVFIDASTYNSQPITPTHTTFQYQKNNTVNFTASTINFFEEQSNFTYTYKLAPIQTNWISSATNNFNFNDLQPNKYTFYIEANGIQKKVSFVIKPLWWQTNWFKILATLIALTLTVLVVWFISKRNQIKKNKNVLQEKRIIEIQLKALRSQMNPHFVFNSLAAIQYYINNNEIEASETYLVKFSKLIRQFFELSKETEINLEQEIKLIKNYLDIEKLRFKEKFEYQIHIDELLNTKTNKIPTMLLQPIVENAVNHGIFNKMDNGTILIHFTFIDEKSYKVEVIDDGVGVVNTQKKGKRNVKSSTVLNDRLKFLNQSEHWNISYATEELHPTRTDKGNKSTFIITQL